MGERRFMLEEVLDSEDGPLFKGRGIVITEYEFRTRLLRIFQRGYLTGTRLLYNEAMATLLHGEGEKGEEKTVNLHDTVDAKAWVVEWLKTIKKHPDIPTDEGTMLGWFANAIMAGYDAAMNKKEYCVCGKPLGHKEPCPPDGERDQPSPTPTREEWERWLIDRPQYWSSERAIEIWFLSMPIVPKE